MESLPNEILLLIFNYLKTSDIVYSFYFLKRRYARLIEEFRPFTTSINLSDVPMPVFNLYSSLLFRTFHIDRSMIQLLKLDCFMLQKFFLNEKTFPNLQTLAIIVRKTDELSILLKYFSLFKSLKQLYIRSDVCCCDRLSFEEHVKRYLFQTSRNQLQALTFATPPCYSISLQDVQFEQSLLTNLTLTVRSMNDFCLILSSARRLRSLRIRVLDTQVHHQNPLTLTSPPADLTHLLFICLHSISYDIIKNIFKTLTPLIRLSFSLVFDLTSGIIDGNRLRDDIFIHLPRLQTIQFEMKSLMSIISSDFIETFKTSFWSRFSPIGFHSFNHIYTLPFPFHHLDLDQSILKREQTRPSKNDWNSVRDVDLYDRSPYTIEFLSKLRNEFSRLTTLTLKWRFDLATNTGEPLNQWFSLPTVRRLTIKSAHQQNSELIQQLLLSLPNCDTLDCDYVLIARTTSYFRPTHRLRDFGRRLRLLLVDELPSDWKIDRKKRRNYYFHRFRTFFPNIECPLYN